MDSIFSVQNQNFSGNTKELAEVLGPKQEPQKSFTLTIPWNLAKLVKNYPGIIVRRHHTAQSERMDICSIAAIRFG